MKRICLILVFIVGIAATAWTQEVVDLSKNRNRAASTYDRAEAEIYYDRAMDYSQDRNAVAEVHDSLVKSIMADPSFDKAYYQLAVVYYRDLGQSKTALDILKEGEHLNPKSALLHFGLASIYKAEGFNYTAQEEVEKAIDLNPKHLKANLLLLSFYVELQEYELALKQAQKVLKLDPENEFALEVTQKVELEKESNAEFYGFMTILLVVLFAIAGIFYFRVFVSSVAQSPFVRFFFCINLILLLLAIVAIIYFKSRGL